jgi:hypothetical protein
MKGLPQSTTSATQDTRCYARWSELLAVPDKAAKSGRTTIIAVDNSPLEYIEELPAIDFVMKGGKVYKD